MLAVGCLVPFVCIAIGAALGSYWGADRGGYWGAGAGFAGGLLLVGIVLAMFNRARRQE